MHLTRKSSQRRALMATFAGELTLIPIAPPMESDAPASLAQFLQIEKARERLRNAAARLKPIRIG